MPDVTSIDLSSARRREDEDEERLRDQPARPAADPHAALDAALKRAHGDPDKIREIVQKQRALGKRDLDESERELAANDSPPLRADNLDATSPDARRAIDAHLHKAISDAGGPTVPADVPVGTPTLDLSARADTMTRQQVETQIALTKQALASFGVMSNPVAAAQIAARFDALRQRQLALSPPMPFPESFPNATALLCEREKQKAFLASAEGKLATPEERAVRERYIERLGNVAQMRIDEWAASPAGQEAAKKKRDAMLKAGTLPPPPQDPNTVVSWNERGQMGTPDQLALDAARNRWEDGQRAIDSIQGGPLGAGGYLLGKGLGLDEASSGQLAALGSIGDQLLANHFGSTGRETERIRDAVFAGEQSQAGRVPGEIGSLNKFFATSGSPLQYWSLTMDGFDPGSRVSTLSEDLPAVRYFTDPTKARGMWLTETPVADPQRDFALPPENTAVSKKEWVIPAGTLVLRGTCAPLNGQPGGGSQIFIANPNTLREP